jgi:hypothetical protein
MQCLNLLKIAQITKTVRLKRKRHLRKNAALAFGKIILSPVRANAIVRLADFLAQTLGHGVHIGSLLGPYGSREFMEREWVNRKVEVEFEGRLLPAPYGYDKILTRIYGDYMALPPIGKRVSHHSFTAFSVPRKGVRLSQAVDGGLEVDEGVEGAVLELARGNSGGECLDGIEPRARGGSCG